MAVPPKEAEKRLRGMDTLLHWKRQAAVSSGLAVPLPFKTVVWIGQGSGNLNLQTKKCIWRADDFIQYTLLIRRKTKTEPSDCPFT